MPVTIPTLDPSTGELVDREYWDMAEVAAMLHVSTTTVRRFVLAGDWPSLKLGRAHWLSAEHIGWIVDQGTTDPPPFPGIPDAADRPPVLGIPLADSDLEGIR